MARSCPSRLFSLLMSNLLPEPGLAVTESDRKRRERFKLGVFAVLTTAAIVLGAALLYKARQTPGLISGEAPTVTNSSSATNDP